jgi:hypothetical protein
MEQGSRDTATRKRKAVRLSHSKPCAEPSKRAMENPCKLSEHSWKYHRDQLHRVLQAGEPRSSLILANLHTMAKCILTNTSLVANGRCHKIRELEIYLSHPSFVDPFVHIDPFQVVLLCLPFSS